MQVSPVCRSFIDSANRRDWRNAVLNLNGLNMYELLRALKALDPADIAPLRAAMSALGGAVFGARIDYALSVVVNNSLPATAPGDLAATGQVTEARNFQTRPSSILVEAIPAAAITGYNAGLTSPSNSVLMARFGAPRATYTAQCQPITNATLARRMVTRNVGPFRVTGLDSAVISLTRIMADIAAEQRLVYRVLGTRGMGPCARYVSRSATSVSNHSWGIAIDLTIDRALDAPGDNQIQFGLELIAQIFNRAGWYWGAAFRREDAMHFEAGTALVQTW